MSRREAAFLLVGLGIGLTFGAAAFVDFAWSFHHMFIVGMRWSPASALLATPLLLLFIGVVILYRGNRKENPR
jgi:hypothetical protein